MKSRTTYDVNKNKRLVFPESKYKTFSKNMFKQMITIAYSRSSNSSGFIPVIAKILQDDLQKDVRNFLANVLLIIYCDEQFLETTNLGVFFHKI